MRLKYNDINKTKIIYNKNRRYYDSNTKYSKQYEKNNQITYYIYI